MKTLKIMLLASMLITGIANATGEEFDMEQFNTRWESAFNNGDLDSLARLYADNAVVVPPTLEIISTPTSIKAFWADKRRNGTSDFRYAPVNVRAEGNRIYQTGTWSAVVRSNSVDTRLTGDLTQVMARQPDGEWKIEVQNMQ